MYFTSILGLMLFSLTVSQSVAAECTALKPDTPGSDLVDFLRHSLDTPLSVRSTECIEFALEQLNFKRSSDTVPVIVNYLDFERPLTPAEKEGFSFHGGPRNIAGRYPATGALMMAGKAAVPALVSAIKTDSSSMVRRNATYTIMQIFRTEPAKGIELLKQEALTSSAQASANLKGAAAIAVQWCNEKQRVQCEYVAHGENR
jgi:hypothetical protein